MRFFTLGGGYTSNIFITYIGAKIDGPVDNTKTFAGFKAVPTLFDGTFKKAVEEQTVFTAVKEKFLMLLEVAGYYYRPETYSKLTFSLSLKNRFKNLETHLNEKTDDVYFAYSTVDADENLSDRDIKNILSNLPEFVRKRLIIISDATFQNINFKNNFPTFIVKNQKDIDIYENNRPLVLSDWDKFIEEQTEKGFFPKVEQKTISEILD